MIGTTKAIYDTLIADSTLMGFLALNKPYYKPNDTTAPTKANSVLPFAIIERKLDCPFMTIGEGQNLRIGEFLESETIYIRCYNDMGKTFVDINKVLDRVKSLLDKSSLTIEDRTKVKIVFESTLDGLVDEAIGLKFKESRYRILVL